MAGKFDITHPIKIGGNRIGKSYERAIAELSHKYHQDVDNALKTSLSNIGVSVEDLRQGDLIMIPNSVASYTDYFYKSTLLFRLHSRPDLVKFGGWWIEYFNKP